MDYSATFNAGDRSAEKQYAAQARVKTQPPKNPDIEDSTVEDGDSSTGLAWLGEGDKGKLAINSDSVVMSGTAVVSPETIATLRPQVDPRVAVKDAMAETFRKGVENSFSANRLVAAIGQLEMMMGGALLSRDDRVGIIGEVRDNLIVQNRAALSDLSYNKMIGQVLVA